METENVEIIKAMVASGAGITVISHAAIARDLKQKRLAFARIRRRKLYRETGRPATSPRAITETLRIFDSMRDQFTAPVLR